MLTDQIILIITAFPHVLIITYFSVESDLLMTSSSNEKECYSSKGLTIERIVPYSKWRITYNGLLPIKKLDNPNENNDAEPQHVLFTFL